MGLFTKKKKNDDEDVVQAPKRSRKKEVKEVEVTQYVEETVEVIEDDEVVEKVIEKEVVQKVNLEVERKPKRKKRSNQPTNSEVIVQNKEYYRDAHFNGMRITFVVVCILFISIGANIIQAFNTPDPLYFASDNEMRLAPMTPLSEPQMSQGGLLNWVAESVASTFTYDFRNWKNQFDDVRDRYSKKAFKEMMASLKKGSLEMVVSKRYLSSCIATATPIISKEGILNGVKTWIIKVPITITYESSDGVENQQDLEVKMIVERCPTSSNPRGVQIAQLVTAMR